MSLTDFDVGVTLALSAFGRIRLAKKRSEKGSFVALKIFKKKDVVALKQMSHLKSEIILLKNMSNRFFVKYLGHFQTPERVYLATEFLPGGELFSYLRSQGKLADDTSKFYTAEVLMAISHLHSKHIVHRDLKPETVLFDQEGHVKLADLTFAKQLKEGGRTWTFCGTPEYIAPEIIDSKEGHGIGVDYWALGILIYEMNAGFPPFHNPNPFSLYQMVVKGKYDMPKQLDPKAKDLVKKLLTEPAKRLGCQKNGIEDIKKHKWFGKLDWTALDSGTLKAPFEPEISGDGDSHLYESYPEEDDDSIFQQGDASPTPSETDLLSQKQRGDFDQIDSL